MIATPPSTNTKVESSTSTASLGSLLSPEEFARECANTRERPVFDSWAIGIHLPDAIVRFMESALVPTGTALAMYSSANGLVYSVAVFQAAGMQLRLLLRLDDLRTQQWLSECLTTGRMRLAIEVLETGQLAVLHGRLSRQSSDEVDEHIRECTGLTGAERLIDTTLLAQSLMEPKFLPSTVSGLEVETVHVILVKPGGEGPSIAQNPASAQENNVFH